MEDIAMIGNGRRDLLHPIVEETYLTKQSLTVSPRQLHLSWESPIKEKAISSFAQFLRFLDQPQIRLNKSIRRFPGLGCSPKATRPPP